MLIYNKKMSVCPVTTHVPLKKVSKRISKKLLNEKVYRINNFYKNFFKKILSVSLNTVYVNLHGKKNDTNFNINIF